MTVIHKVFRSPLLAPKTEEREERGGGEGWIVMCREFGYPQCPDKEWQRGGDAGEAAGMEEEREEETEGWRWENRS